MRYSRLVVFPLLLAPFGAHASPPPGAFEIQQTAGDSLFVTLSSADGVLTTQFIVGESTPRHGVIFRYADQQLFGLDYETRQYAAISLDEDIAAKVLERSMLSAPIVGED